MPALGNPPCWARYCGRSHNTAHAALSADLVPIFSRQTVWRKWQPTKIPGKTGNARREMCESTKCGAVVPPQTVCGRTARIRTTRRRAQILRCKQSGQLQSVVSYFAPSWTIFGRFGTILSHVAPFWAAALRMIRRKAAFGTLFVQPSIWPSADCVCRLHLSAWRRTNGRPFVSNGGPLVA